MVVEARLYVKREHILAVVSVVAEDEVTHMARFEPCQLDAALTWLNNVLAIHSAKLNAKLKLN
jgi:hypothetical protein